ncbi:MAG: hypothetical protein FWG36_00250 [Oscillospiraceae bacterium]|nr:hypothetical protein [Oscillospiraceae bacterium]
MTLITQKELCEYLALKREIESQKQRADALEYQVRRGYETSWWTRHKPPAAVKTNLIAKKVGLEVSIFKNLEILESQTLRVEEAIQAIDDSLLREILRLRYIDGLEWDKLGDKIGYVTRQCFRFHRKALNELYRTQCVGELEFVK